MKKVIITVMLALISLTVSCGADKSENKNETTMIESADNNNNDKVSEGTEDNSKESTTDKNKAESTSTPESSKTTNENSSSKTGNKKIYKDKLDKIQEGVKKDLDSLYAGNNQEMKSAAGEE